jgi:hypothetical protein
MTKTQKFKVYKGITGKWGAIQFDLKPGTSEEPGVIFMEITSAIGPNKYDWDNKIIIALSATDIGKILHYMSYGNGDGMSLMHDPGAGTETKGKTQKFLNIDSPQGFSHGMFITVGQVKDEVKKQHKVPLNGEEALILRSLLNFTLPRLFNWI